MLRVAFIFEQIGTKRDVRVPGNAHKHTNTRAHTHNRWDTRCKHTDTMFDPVIKACLAGAFYEAN